MSAAQKHHPVIALEEHYLDPEVAELERSSRHRSELARRLLDLGELRIKEMDEAGIDIQVIGHAGSTVERLNPETAVEVAIRANDRLQRAVSAQPDRFAAFAVLPTPDPVGAADELERAVTRLGFKGAMVHGLTDRHFLDEKRFWPIFERAAALDVPIYVHPAAPHAAVAEAYYKEYLGDYPSFGGAAWGYTVEGATQGIRFVLSGIFDAYPGLKIILGHMGESIPFSLWRIEEVLTHPPNKPIAFRDCFREHFYVTTSGNFSTTALMCSIAELGIERVLFSVDWPYVDNREGTKWMAGLDLAADDKARILGGNAASLLGIATT